VATLRFTPAALADLERLAEFLRESDPAAAVETITLILDGARLLQVHPLIGRPIDAARRELLVFRGRFGYAAQYNFRPANEEVVILAVRHQREVEE
jgi:plasmid stabilization system protein ParE